MNARAKKRLWWLGAMLMLASGGYFLTFGHCFLPLPKCWRLAGETIEIRDYEAFVEPLDSDTYAGALARGIWRFTCPGQVRLVDAAKTPAPGGECLSSKLQMGLTRLGYEFPHGCFAEIVPPNAKLRIAHYPSVLNRVQKDLNVRLIASAPRTDLMDPGPGFQKSFERADRLEFVIHGSDRFSTNHNVVTVDNLEDVRRFFANLQFVPYDKGSSWVCNCDGDENVRVYSEDSMVGEFTIHHGTSVKWKPLGTHILLTTEAREALDSYLNQQVYAMKLPVRVLEKNAPLFGLAPFAVPDNNLNGIEKE